MRTIKFFTIAIAMMILTISNGVSKDPTIMEVTGKSTFKLVLNNISNRVEIRLKDQYGQILHQEDVSGNSYARLYNVRDLPNGEYLVELESGFKVQIFPLSIRAGEVSVTASKYTEFFKPVVRQKEKLVTINMLSTDQKPLSVVMYDDKQRLLFEEQLKGKMTLGRRYNLSSLRSGTYQLNLTSNGRSYTHSLLVQ